MTLGLTLMFVLAVAAIALLAMSLAPHPSQQGIHERLISTLGAGAEGNEPMRQKPSWTKALGALEPLNRAPQLDKMKQHLDTKLTSGHVRLTALEFLGLQEIIAVAAMAFYVVIVGPAKAHWLLLVAAGLFGFIVPDLMLRSHIKARQRTISRDLPEVVDLLTLCVEAGADFMGAITRVVKEYKKCPLIEELSIVMQEIRVGKRRRDALRALANRVKTMEVSSLVRTLVQADRMGTGIAEALRIQSEESRLHRYHYGERLAQQAPLKMLIPLIFFIMPTVAIIVGGPIMIQFMRGNLIPKM